MTDFRFQSPPWLLALVAWIAIESWRRRRRTGVVFSSLSLVSGLPVTMAQRLARFLPWIERTGLLLLILALARPQMGREQFRVRSDGVALVLCIDKSGSMKSLDFEWNDSRVDRLDVVKRLSEEFVTGGETGPGRREDLIGLLAFGGFVDTLCPPTLDHAALVEQLRSIEIPKPLRDSGGKIVAQSVFEEEMATAIGDAVVAGIDRLRNTPAKSRVIVLVSDGENTAGAVTPRAAALAAKELGIKIYTIGVGTTGYVPFPEEDRLGRRILTRKYVQIDEETLRMMAETTGGAYFNGQDSRALRAIYGRLDQLEKTTAEGTLYTHYRELYGWPLASGFVLLWLAWLAKATRLRSTP